MSSVAGEPGSVGDALLARTAELVAIPSVSHHEHEMADAVEAALRACPWIEVHRSEDDIVARTELGHSHRLVLAGHLDTVAPAAGHEHVIVQGDRLVGLGAADMKGGIAVFLHLAEQVPEPAVDLTWSFNVCEEVAAHHSGLRRMWAEHPELLEADAAIVGEPTDGVVEAGCQGTLRISVGLRGVRAHTSRPAEGRNAIHRLVPLLGAIGSYVGRTPELDGCRYMETLQAVAVEGGVAGNVVPDSASLLVNHRFAPDRDAAAAVASVRELLEPWLEEGDTFDVVEVVAGAPPHLDDPLLGTLVARSGRPPRAKLGWTDVATFWSHGVPAANFGPGDPLVAHTAGEYVTAGQLERAYAALHRLVTEPLS